MPYHCQRCPIHGQCATCKRLGADAQQRRRARGRALLALGESPEDLARLRACAVIKLATGGGEADAWLLMEDGELDLEAICIATHGTRRVKLTLRERIAAGTAIFLHQGSARTVCERLSLPRVVRE